MLYQIKIIKPFQKDIKQLAKKHPNIQKDLECLFEILSQGNIIGTKLQNFNANLYKVRLKSSDNNKGKSGGFRIIYEVKKSLFIIRLIEIYSKSNKTNINNTKIQKRLA